MANKKYTRSCSAKGCTRLVYRKVKRPHGELCFDHWSKKYPEEFKKFCAEMKVR